MYGKGKGRSTRYSTVVQRCPSKCTLGTRMRNRLHPNLQWYTNERSPGMVRKIVSLKNIKWKNSAFTFIASCRCKTRKICIDDSTENELRLLRSVVVQNGWPERFMHKTAEENELRLEESRLIAFVFQMGQWSRNYPTKAAKSNE